MGKIYKEAKISRETSYDWREGWISTEARAGGKTIAEYVANEGTRIYVDGKWDEGSSHDDENTDDFVGVKTATGIVPLSDWMRDHEETDTVEDNFCADIAAAYADFVLDGKKTLSWKSDRGFANSGWYWTDEDEDEDGNGPQEDPDQVWDLETEYQAAKQELATWYQKRIYKKRNPAAHHEYNNISLPDDKDFIRLTF
jgi:hypothetical protein